MDRDSFIFLEESEQRPEHQIFESSINSNNDQFDDQKPKNLRLTNVSQVEDKPEKNQSKIKENSQKSSKPGRVTNYLMPNMIREIKQCLSNAFPADNKKIYKFLEKLFSALNIKFQIWAFQAILLCLLYLRDVAQSISQKKYLATIEAISSTLQKYKEKFLVRTDFSQEQLKVIRDHYTLCIKHLKLYDDQMNTFEVMLSSKREQARLEFLRDILLSRKNLAVNYIKILRKIGVDLRSRKYEQRKVESIKQQIC